MNKVILMGRLTKNPDVRANDKVKVARYTLAVDRPKQGDTKEADFISCVCFGKTADFAESYLKQGTKVLIEGRILTGSYEKDGRKVYTTDVVVSSHEFAESKKDEPKEEKKDKHGFSQADDEGLPFK